ncbi:GAF domain-containing sensor histidine kinase [Candidatus Solirubrobacter pratensis]|uniref:GAF domain-containing sensor histidine kinase n=1 Tax=Candidatus Solirubrobacter pratensis TaxID=1298857 RepID=UPI0004218FDB|nr:GAF domain-containing sensor histidine kinase [Candidatus Solirubrobacter pratensis]
MDEQRLRRLLDVGRSLISELEPETVLQRLLEVARELTGSSYAAIGVLDERRERLERFLTVGIDEETHRQIGDLPRGRGVLGVLIDDPRPLRLADVGAHPRSYGFPLAHPAMTSFLGVPILIEGEAWGNLYLTEKAEGQEFTDDDEEAAIVLAGWAAIAISNARLYRTVSERRDELERAIRGLETMTEISRALGGVTDLERVLELVAKRSRALIDARAAEIALVDGDEFVIAAVAGEGVERLRSRRVPIANSVAAAAIKTGKAQRFSELPPETLAARELGARTAIVAPMLFRNRPVGFLVVLDRMGADRPFGEDDERLLEAFAASAATAVATAQMAGDEALRRSIEASEAERRRWARELHDDTLQHLAGLRVLLSGARRSGDPDRITFAIGEAIELLTDGIASLRALITDLRPAALDELGTKAALETLAARVAEQSGLEVELDVRLAFDSGEAAARHLTEIESTTYRLVQEGLTNVVKHADATRVEIRVFDVADAVEIMLRDDGRGFEPHADGGGFGLIGMRERVALVQGTLEVESAPGEGTTLRARIPARRRGHGHTA